MTRATTAMYKRSRESPLKYTNSRTTTLNLNTWNHSMVCEPEDRSGYHSRLKLDQIMKVLLKLSKKVIVQLINQLFDESFKSEDVEISYGNTEFVDTGPIHQKN